MHRRARHLKGTSIGCTLQLDARYLTDSDGTALSTWTDRSSNAYSASQATSTKQPLVKTGANGINGSTAVSFDGSNDGMSIANVVLSSDFYYVFAVKINAANMIFEHSPNTNTNEGFNIWGNNNNAIAIRRSNSPGYNIIGTASWLGTSPATSSFYHYQINNASNANYYLNGSVITKVGESGNIIGTSNATKTFYIFTRGDSGLFTNGLLGAVIFGSGTLSQSLRIRVEHSMAYSFKTACS